MLRHPENIERALAFLNVYADEVITKDSFTTYWADGRLVAQCYHNEPQCYRNEPLLFIINGLGF